jgi:hypothetical protein
VIEESALPASNSETGIRTPSEYAEPAEREVEADRIERIEDA